MPREVSTFRELLDIMRQRGITAYACRSDTTWNPCPVQFGIGSRWIDQCDVICTVTVLGGYGNWAAANQEFDRYWSALSAVATENHQRKGEDR